jgi:hypothetical protein
VDISTIGPSAAAVVIVLAFLKYLKEQGTSTYERDKAFVKAIDKMTAATELVAAATEKGSKEAKERNGHLAELVIQSQETTKKLADRNFKASQTVRQQHVEHQHISNKEEAI